MLPDIVAEDGKVALRDRVVLIRRGHDMDFAAFAASRPIRCRIVLRGIIELGLEISEVESFRDGLGDRADGIASAFGLHDLPEHGVVDVAAAVIADCAANVFGDGVGVAD